MVGNKILDAPAQAIPANVLKVQGKSHKLLCYTRLCYTRLCYTRLCYTRLCYNQTVALGNKHINVSSQACS